MARTLAARAGAEMLGSLATYCLAVGGVANALLPRTKGEGMGLLAIALAVGLGIAMPMVMFSRVSAYFNPAILLAETVRGRVGGAGTFFALLGAELAGYFTGALVLYIFYFPHFNAAVQLPAADEVDRLLRDPAKLNNVALMNASYNLGAPSVTTPQSFLRFALKDLKAELRKALSARKVGDPFRTCPEDMNQAVLQLPQRDGADPTAAAAATAVGGACGLSKPTRRRGGDRRQDGVTLVGGGRHGGEEDHRDGDAAAAAEAGQRYGVGGGGVLPVLPVADARLSEGEEEKQVAGLQPVLVPGSGSSGMGSGAEEEEEERKGGSAAAAAAAPTYAERLHAKGAKSGSFKSGSTGHSGMGVHGVAADLEAQHAQHGWEAQQAQRGWEAQHRQRGQLAAALCKARQDVLLSVFVTRPAMWSPLFNFLQEFIATTIMATCALLIFQQGRHMDPAAASAYPPQAALLVGLLNTVVVLSLGGATGPAMNPARDLGPRMAFHLLPIPGKGCSEWHYGWVPVLGGFAGGAVAGGLVSAISKLIE